MASTGSNRDAEIAGITPEIKPIAVESKNPNSMLEKDNTNSKSSVKLEATCAMILVSSSNFKPSSLSLTMMPFSFNRKHQYF